MAYQTVFKRYELKYIMTREQKARVLKAMEPYMTPDKFGRSTIRNIYFDSDDFILARHSIAKPDFKEKLRIRSYAKAGEESTVFVELKRKADHLVYKRRVALPERAAMNWTQGLTGRNVCVSGTNCNPVTDPAEEQVPASVQKLAVEPIQTQMRREIDYFLSYYGSLRPAAFLSYDRQAYKMRDCSPELNSAGGHDQDFRVTFDENILFRDYDLSLTSDVYGERVLDDDKVLMELKCSGGIPLWMVKVLSAEGIYKTSFSKYGTAYALYIQPELRKAAEVKATELQASQEKSVELQQISEKEAARNGHNGRSSWNRGYRRHASKTPGRYRTAFSDMIYSLL